MPIITVGVCVRNCQNYIKDAINSISQQDFPHQLMELVFVDDGSKDGTLSIIEESLSEIDIPAKVIRSSWKGVGHARNLVIANATGDYILWVDGDMILAKDFMSRLVVFIKENPNVGIVKGKQSIKECGNFLSTLEAQSRAASRMINYQSKSSRCKALGTGGAIYRVAAIRQVGGFDDNLKGYGEDLDIEIRIRDAGWSLHAIEAEFVDYERNKLTFNGLWRKYWLRGYYSHYFYHKNTGLLKHSRMFPLAAFIAGFLQSRKLFRLTRKKIVFLMPFEHFFKTFAWYVGYINSHFDSYEPSS
jgi:glycosyltransferase involved in cell wall biosynthesis